MSLRGSFLPSWLKRRALWLGALVAVLAFVVVFWRMATEPYRFSTDWYARGGLRRAVLVLAADVFGPLVASPRSNAHASFSLPSRVPRPSGRPNVLVLGIDGLRADAVDPARTPNLAAIADASVRFDRAYVTNPETSASWKTLFSGRDAHRSVDEAAAFDDAFPDRFARAGYRTSAIGSDDVRRTARDVVRALSSEASSSTPWLLTVRFSQTLPPFAVPEAYRRPFTDRTYRGRFKYAATPPTDRVDARDVAQWRALYDGSLAAVDAAIGEIVHALVERHEAERTILVVASPHGQSLLEGAPDPGEGLGMDVLADATLHVPLLIAAPGYDARRVSALVRDVDVAPTLYALAGVEAPSNLDGVSLLPALRGEDLPPRLAFAQAPARDVNEAVMRPRAVRDERYELVAVPTRKGVQYTLFDTANDPGATTDVAQQNPGVASRLRDALRAWLLENSRMEALGEYVLPKPARGPKALGEPHDVIWIDGGDLSSVEHGVVFSRAYASALEEPERTDALLDGLPSLLSDVGYATRAFVEEPSADAPLDSWSAFGRTTTYPRGERVTMADDVAGFVEERAEEPVFAFVRWSSPSKHRPLVPLASSPEEDRPALDALLHMLAAAHRIDRTLLVFTGASNREALRGVRAPAKARAFEEAAHMGLRIVAPGFFSSDRVVDARVRSDDVAPTLLELLTVEPPFTMRGRSLVGLANGAPELYERAVVTEGKGMRSLVHGHHRLVVPRTSSSTSLRSRAALFDLDVDPRHRRDVATREPDVTAEMIARLEAARAGATVAGEQASMPVDRHVLSLRFVSAGVSRRVSGSLSVDESAPSPRISPVVLAPLGPEALTVHGARVDFAFTTLPSSPVGFDVVIEPSAAPVRWEFFLDDEKWPKKSVFGGPFGLSLSALDGGIETASARRTIAAEAFPPVDPGRELGLFVIRAEVDPR